MVRISSYRTWTRWNAMSKTFMVDWSKENRIKLDLLCAFMVRDDRCSHPKIMIWLNECRYKNLILCQFQLHTIIIIFIMVASQKMKWKEMYRSKWTYQSIPWVFKNVFTKLWSRHWILNIIINIVFIKQVKFMKLCVWTCRNTASVIVT